MKEAKYYVCECCGTQYASKENAIDCEKNHKAPVSIVSTRSLSKAQDATGYPVTITVKMRDGKQVVYKR